MLMTRNGTWLYQVKTCSEGRATLNKIQKNKNLRDKIQNLRLTLIKTTCQTFLIMLSRTLREAQSQLVVEMIGLTKDKGRGEEQM